MLPLKQYATKAHAKTLKKVYGYAIPSEGILRINKLLNRGGREGNIAILYSGRCGATVLGHLLEQHPDIHWGGEFFNHVNKKYKNYAWFPDCPLKILEKAMYRRRSRFYGFETKALRGGHLRPHWINSTTASYVNSLINLGFEHFVILKRKNYLKQAVSSAIARQRMRWTSPLSEELTLEKVSIDVGRFRYGDDFKPLLEHFRNLDSYYEELGVLLKKQKVMNLTYEDDIEPNPKEAFQKICNFVGADTVPVEVKLQKIDPFSLDEVLLNRAEVKTAISNTKYGWMLVE